MAALCPYATPINGPGRYTTLPDATPDTSSDGSPTWLPCLRRSPGLHALECDAEQLASATAVWLPQREMLYHKYVVQYEDGATDSH